jgi:uncharacterized protein YbaA (DUF1428 family)
MERYVDGFVIPIKKENVERYKKMARKAGEIWMEHGALEFYETIGDDLDIENAVTFKKLADIADDETVIFSWIVYESKEQRDKINELIMNDPRITEDMDANKDVFDMKRMTYGGFKPVVVLEK